MKSRNTFLNKAGVVLIAAIVVFTALLVCTPPTKATEAPLPVILSENFSSGVPPPGWGTNAPAHWLSSATNFAGGVAPEAMYSGLPSESGTFRLYTCMIDTTGYTDLALEFWQYVDHYTAPYTLEVQTSTDGGATWGNVWATTPSSNVGPQKVGLLLSTADGVGSPTLQISWTFSGNSVNINHWYIDNVNLRSGSIPDLVIWRKLIVLIGDDQYDPPTTQTGGWYDCFPGGPFSFVYRFLILIQNDGSIPMDSTIQAQILPGSIGPVWGLLAYPGPGGTTVYKTLPCTTSPLAQITPLHDYVMTLRIIKFIPLPSNIVKVKVDVVTSAPPLVSDSVTVHT